MINPYEHLKIPAPAVIPAVSEEFAEDISSQECPEEIKILTARLADGSWTYGFYVRWLSGRVSFEKPSPDRGFFASRDDASRHCLGLFLSGWDAFSIQARADIDARGRSLSQFTIDF